MFESVIVATIVLFCAVFLGKRFFGKGKKKQGGCQDCQGCGGHKNGH